jgi:FKBP-type peptidyl-prolyl cis-trans isomerase FkpA
MMDSKMQGNPVQQPISKQGQKFDLNAGLVLMRAGDKATFRIPIKELFAENPEQPKPEWINENDHVVFHIEAISISSAADFQKEMKEKQAKEEAEMAAQSKAAGANDIITIEEYLKSNNISNFKKTASGLFYVIHKSGNGANPNSGQKVTVNYTGKLLNGKVFDSNTDPKFQHVQPFDVTVGQGSVIPGWDEGLLLFNKGTKATLYIPSNLGYGPRGAGADIPANAILIFDIEVLDIK